MCLYPRSDNTLLIIAAEFVPGPPFGVELFTRRATKRDDKQRLECLHQRRSRLGDSGGGVGVHEINHSVDGEGAAVSPEQLEKFILDSLPRLILRVHPRIPRSLPIALGSPSPPSKSASVHSSAY